MIRKNDDFTLNCRSTVPVGCEEQVGNAKCTRPSLLVEGLAPRLQATLPAESFQHPPGPDGAFWPQNYSVFARESTK